MKLNKVFQTIKIVLILFLVLIVFLLVGFYYQRICYQNSHNILPANMQGKNLDSDSSGIQKEKETHTSVAGTEPENPLELEIEIEEKDYRDSGEWVRIIKFE